jgi:hypothetical protein
MTLLTRILLIALVACAVLASLANPHFFFGGSFDVYGIAPWWQRTAVIVDMGLPLLAAVALWRSSARAAFGLLVCELAFYVLLTAASARAAGGGYFSNGWSREFYSVFWFALIVRGTLLWSANRQHVSSRAPAT